MARGIDAGGTDEFTGGMPEGVSCATTSPRRAIVSRGPISSVSKPIMCARTNVTISKAGGSKAKLCLRSASTRARSMTARAWPAEPNTISSRDTSVRWDTVFPCEPPATIKAAPGLRKLLKGRPFQPKSSDPLRLSPVNTLARYAASCPTRRPPYSLRPRSGLQACRDCCVCVCRQEPTMTTASPHVVSTPSSAEPLERTLGRMKEAQRKSGAPSAEDRIRSLERLERAPVSRKTAVVEAVGRDFGNRSKYETLISEVYLVLGAIKHTKAHLRDWMETEEREAGWMFLPSSVELIPQPLGVIGIISPWNYPVQLALSPPSSARSPPAIGSDVLKPSELASPEISAALLRDLIADTFPEDQVTVVTGGSDVGEAFSRLPFDHLVFTGSTRVGKLVMRAASENLVPVTLELGGKFAHRCLGLQHPRRRRPHHGGQAFQQRTDLHRPGLRDGAIRDTRCVRRSVQGGGRQDVSHAREQQRLHERRQRQAPRTPAFLRPRRQDSRSACRRDQPSRRVARGRARATRWRRLWCSTPTTR